MQLRNDIMLRIGIGILAALGLATGLVLVSPSSNTPQQSSIITISSSSTRTAECGSPGVYCGSFIIDAITLHPTNLTFTLTNTGNLDLSNIIPRFNGTEITQVQGLGVGQTATYAIQIPPRFNITSGQTYTIQIDSTIVEGGHVNGGPITEVHIIAK